MSTDSTANSTVNSNQSGDGKFHFCIDRGGTFTDVFCRLPNGDEVVRKLLSEDPSHYPDAPTEGIRRILQEFDIDGGRDYTRSTAASAASSSLINTSQIGSIRMGTTVATNALLERDGAPMALLITQGFLDALDIGNQSRPNIFDLSCHKPALLYQRVVEIDERIVLKQFASHTTTKAAAWNNGSLAEAKGVTGESILVLQAPDLTLVRQQLLQLRDAGITSLAICFLHSYVWGQHERLVGDLAASLGCFTQISLSHQVMPMVKLVPRGHTACAAAYLTPKIDSYLANFCKGFDQDLLRKVSLTFMKSDGGLAPVDDFGGHQAILSGPAGTIYYSCVCSASVVYSSPI
jgi:5-oxoprolinase (ATP-hydrolysing)